MKVSIFIRTYRADIKWLDYCLKSIHKNLTGCGEIVICIPTGQEHLLKSLTAEKVIVCKTYKDDYIGQQVSKLEAYRHCKGEYILFVDSDVVFFPGADVRDYFKDNLPVILYDKYENVGEAIVWKPVVEKLFKETVNFEFMRRAPQLFHKKTLENFSKSFSDIENYAISQPHRKFSEFNILGFYAWKNERENYKFIEAKFTTGSHENEIDSLPQNRSKQFWSWSGLTQSERNEIENTI